MCLAGSYTNRTETTSILIRFSLLLCLYYSHIYLVVQHTTRRRPGSPAQKRVSNVILGKTKDKFKYTRLNKKYLFLQRSRTLAAWPLPCRFPVARQSRPIQHTFPLCKAVCEQGSRLSPARPASVLGMPVPEQ